MSRMLRIFLLPGLLATSAYAQSPPAASAVAPAASLVDGARLPVGAWRVEMTMQPPDGTPHALAYELRIARTQHDGKPALMAVQGMGSAVDSTLLLVDGLRPVWHRARHPARTVSYDYSDSRVSGRTEQAGEATRIDRALDAPAFDASTAELVVAALPLADGYHARLPMFTVEQGVSWHDVRVRAGELDGRPVWLALLQYDTTAMELTIDRATRELLRGEAKRADGSTITMKRVRL